MDRVLACVDVDQSGAIAFDEFFITSLDPREILTKENIYIAFRKFDEDDGGSISVQELKTALSSKFQIHEEVWDTLFKRKLQQNNNDDLPEISQIEFKEFLFKIFDENW